MRLRIGQVISVSSELPFALPSKDHAEIPVCLLRHAEDADLGARARLLGSVRVVLRGSGAFRTAVDRLQQVDGKAFDAAHTGAVNVPLAVSPEANVTLYEPVTVGVSVVSVIDPLVALSIEAGATPPSTH